VGFKCGDGDRPFAEFAVVSLEAIALFTMLSHVALFFIESDRSWKSGDRQDFRKRNFQIQD